MNKLIKLTCMFLWMLGFHAQAEIAVVVNINSPIESFTHRELVDLYMGRNLFLPTGGLAVRIDQAPTSNIRKLFYQELVGKSVAEVNAYWAKLLFTGQSTPPYSLDSSKRVLEVIRNNVNAIGYINAEEVDDTVKTVRTLP